MQLAFAVEHRREFEDEERARWCEPTAYSYLSYAPLPLSDGYSHSGTLFSFYSKLQFNNMRGRKVVSDKLFQQRIHCDRDCNLDLTIEHNWQNRSSIFKHIHFKTYGLVNLLEHAKYYVSPLYTFLLQYPAISCRKTKNTQKLPENRPNMVCDVIIIDTRLFAHSSACPSLLVRLFSAGYSCASCSLPGVPFST